MVFHLKSIFFNECLLWFLTCVYFKYEIIISKPESPTYIFPGSHPISIAFRLSSSERSSKLQGFPNRYGFWSYPVFYGHNSKWSPLNAKTPDLISEKRGLLEIHHITSMVKGFGCGKDI